MATSFLHVIYVFQGELSRQCASDPQKIIMRLSSFSHPARFLHGRVAISRAETWDQSSLIDSGVGLYVRTFASGCTITEPK